MAPTSPGFVPTSRGTALAPLLLPVTLGLLVFGGCSPPVDSPQAVVERSIEAHGGDRFEEVEIAFRFRDHEFRVLRDDGLFEYERTGLDDEGRPVRELMTNDGTRKWVDGREIELSAEERASVETAVHSVVYFGFLPFRLDDAAVNLRDLGTAMVEGRELRKIEVTFRQEDGGQDWEDRFVHWFDAEEGTLEHVAYRYHRDEGGTRFRNAFNRREVGGILIQDWENWTGDPEIEDIALYDEWYEDGRLDQVSEVRLEDVRVGRPGDSSETMPAPAPAPEPDDPLEGFQVNVGLETLEYAPGDSLELTIRLSNRSDQERTLAFRDAQRFDLFLRNAEGRQVARWGQERSFAQVLGDVTIGPGEDGPLWEAGWVAPEEPGNWDLLVTVLTREGEIGTTIPIVVR